MANERCCNVIIDLKCRGKLTYDDFRACQSYFNLSAFSLHCLRPPVSNHLVDHILLTLCILFDTQCEEMGHFDYSRVSDLFGAKLIDPTGQFLLFYLSFIGFATLFLYLKGILTFYLLQYLCRKIAEVYMDIWFYHCNGKTEVGGLGLLYSKSTYFSFGRRV